MNNIKKTLLLASVLALSTKMSIDLDMIKAHAAENISESKIEAKEEKLQIENNARDNEVQKEKNIKIDDNKLVKSGTESVLAVAAAIDEGKLINSINEGSETLSDYNSLKLYKVRPDNIKVIAQAIKNAKTNKGANLTKDEISNTITNAVQDISASLDRMDKGKATVNDYQLLLITQVNDSNLEDVNYWLKGKRYQLISRVSDMVTKIVTSVANINNGTESGNDFNQLQIYKAKDELVPFLNRNIQSAKVNKGSDLTSREIAKVVGDALDKLNLAFQRINLGQATLDDYQFIGATNVNDANISDVNEWLNGKGWSEIGNVVNEINSIIEPLKKINSGNGTVPDYEALKIYDVNDDNLENVKPIVAEKRQIKGKDLSIAEIMDAVKESETVCSFSDLIKAGTAKVSDYNDANLTGATESNLADLNELLKNRNCRTLKEFQDNINSIIKSLKNINEGTDTIEDYSNLNISGVTADNIGFIRNDIKNARGTSGDNLNKSKIEESVKSSLKCLAAMDKINAGNGAIEDYTLLGITGVTNDNLTFVNNQVKGSNCKTIEELKAKVAEALKLYESYNRANKGEGTYEDYIKIGIKIKIEEVTYYNEIFKGKNYFTYEEMQIEIKVSIRVRTAYEHIKDGIGTLEDFRIVRYTDVTEYNIDFINRLIIEGGDSTPETIKQIITKVSIDIEILMRWSKGEVTAQDVKDLGLDIVTEKNISYIMERVTKEKFYSKTELILSIKAIIKEKEIYERINLGKATIEDYQYIRVTGVTTTNISSINDYVKNGNLITKETLQAKIDIVVEQIQSITHTEVVINRIGLGQADVSDFEFIGISIVNSFNIEYVNEHLRVGKYTTIEEIKAAVTMFVSQYNSYEVVNKGEATVDIYTSLGITGVTEANIAYINLNIKESRYFTVAEIQAKVNVLISIYQYYEIINKGEATVDIYTSLGITGVTRENISFININIKEGKYFELSSLQSNIKIIEEKYESYVKISLGQATVENYKKIGIIGVTSENISYINLNINLNSCFETTIVQERINVLVKEYNSYIRISQGSAVVEDYEVIKVKGVTNENIKYINCVLKGTSFTEIIKVQARIDEVIKIYEELVRINSGTATVVDYTTIGVSGVTIDNLILINKDMKEKGYLSVSEIKERIEAIFSIETVLGRINSGKGTISDYGEAGVIGVTSANLDYINVNIKGKLFESFNEVQASVKAIIAQYEMNIKIEQIVERINLGTATVEDYRYIEITSVTEVNIDAINEDLKGKDFSDIVAIKERVNVVIKIQASLERVNLGKATLEDFSILGITGVYKDILIYVNSDLKGLNYKNIEDIQKRIDVNLSVYVFLNKVNLGQATIGDYNSLKITGVDINVLVYINEDLKGKNYTTIAEIQERINSRLNIYLAIQKINAGNAVLANYSVLGITDVDANILVYVNEDLKGRNCKIVEEIQTRIAAQLNIYRALQKINAGEAVLNDYSILGITGLDSSLIVYVNADLKGKNYTNADEVKVRIEQNLNVYKILKNINEGNATLEDYSEIGITEVIDFNLYYVNIRIKGSSLVTLAEVEERVRSIIDSIQISTASGVLKDASTGNVVAGVAIRFKIGDGTTGGYLSKDGVEIVVYTDAQGRYSVELPEGSYTAVAQKDGYIIENFSIVANAANENVQQNAALVPVRTDEKYSIVLTWNENPSDLDSHLSGTTANGSTFHVNYSNTSVSENGKVVASLDVDDRTSYGPETITVAVDSKGSYKYSVFDYSDKSNSSSSILSNSGAKVSVYKGNTLVKTYVIATNKVGDIWNVFEIKNGEIVDVNTITYSTVAD
ncbi:hypothetical protein [Clostridium cibarium]|uniref:Uncharacterized protein n=1 Tax=Clostridium cibarium TaxID=2762247 RepID=A0ABR8PP65_9CLOT|nr:hypothetical protein [Clostridium cibarium]MBD7909961.1 hypothetical protein [Clostridium cibarium]